LTISELAERCGVPVSTVRYYLREGLLPAGRRLSRTRTRFDEQHVESLTEIKSLREAGVPISELRARATHTVDAPDDAALTEERRNEILSAATACFLGHGFSGTSLANIARSASMSKATLYRYFSSKEEIFMSCAERAFHQLYADVWTIISQTRSPEERLRIRWYAFVDSFGVWAAMMDLVRGLAVADPTFRRQSLRLTELIVTPMSRELGMLLPHCSDTDAEFLAYVLMGIAEAGSRAVDDGRRTADDVWQDMSTILDTWARAPLAQIATNTDASPPSRAQSETA